jgi:catechol 2,3-dioxygenase-like lactoylglutathione lyase family enzyme
MAFHHVAVATKDAKRSHAFYTQAMGFKLVKVIKRLRGKHGGWARHIFYDTGGGETFAIWDLKHMDGKGVNEADWVGGMATGCKLPTWTNHVAFDCKNREGLEAAKQRLLDNGYHVSEMVHPFIHSIYTFDPDGTMVEFCYDTQPLNQADQDEALALLEDDTPPLEHNDDFEELDGGVTKSPKYAERKRRETIGA